MSKNQILCKNQNESRSKNSQAMLTRGALFGEMPVFSGKPHLMHIRCAEPSELLQLRKYDLEDTLVDFPDFKDIFKERIKDFVRIKETAGGSPASPLAPSIRSRVVYS